MRIFNNPLEAGREVERDVAEMGIDTWPSTMQDKDVSRDEGFRTREVRAYAYKIKNHGFDPEAERELLSYFYPHELESVVSYVQVEHTDRTCGSQLNPGNAYEHRPHIWNEFLHDGEFSYTYSDRMAPQLHRILTRAKEDPDSRQLIVNFHSNIAPNFKHDGPQRTTHAGKSADLFNMGGKGRIPCSLNYQVMIREGLVDLIYCMRSCDLLTHFGIDMSLALRFQSWFARHLDMRPGMFTHCIGSLHAYHRDLQGREAF